jgi:nicotinamidase-related amidase
MNPLPRSTELLSRYDSALLVIDVQEKLCPAILNGTNLVWNITRLIEGAKALQIPTWATEQYPEKLGPSLPEIRDRIPTRWEKRMFSCRECEPLFVAAQAQPIRHILIVGIETHVCVLQTVLDLLAEGFCVSLAVDAIGSRAALDHEIALRRLEASGATLTTTEAALFEWCETSTAAEFKQISALVKQPEPLKI